MATPRLSCEVEEWSYNNSDLTIVGAGQLSFKQSVITALFLCETLFWIVILIRKVID
jgi:hypothetical protein